MTGSLQIKNGIYQAVFYVQGQKNPIWRSTGIKAQRGNKRKAEQKMTEIIARFNNGLKCFDKVNFIDYINIWCDAIWKQVDTEQWLYT